MRHEPKVPIRTGEGIWSSPEQAALVLSVVKENPKLDGEPIFMYLHRIAVLSGLMKPEGPEELSRLREVSRGRGNSDDVAAGEADGD